MRTATHLLASRHVDQTFRIDVFEPQAQGPHPVVYATDGNMVFETLKGISLSLQRTGRDLPSFIVVGIGYPGDSPWAGRFLRRRDLTFPGYPVLDVLNRQQAGEGEAWPAPGAPDLHGGERFQDFLASELIPFIEGAYLAEPAQRLFFGHSGGGMFGLITLFTRPELFGRYVLSSPCLVHRDCDFTTPYLERFLGSPALPCPVRLYASVGGEEEAEAPDWRLVSSLGLLADRLRSARGLGLDVSFEVLAGETHMSAWPISFIRGLRTVFGA